MLELLLFSIVGGAGLSFLFGGDDDTDEVTYDQENNQINGTDGDDQITFTSEGVTDNVLKIDAGAGDDHIDFTYTDTTGAGLQVDAGTGDDIIDLAREDHYGSVYVGTINGGDGDDTITVDVTDFTKIYGGTGDDSITVNTAYNPSIRGDDGDDTIVVDHLIEGGFVLGGEGDDTIIATGGNLADFEHLRGGAGDDTLDYTFDADLVSVPNNWFPETGAEVLGGDDVDSFSLTIDNVDALAAWSEPASILSLPDFEPDLEMLQIDTPTSEGYSAATATLTENGDETTLTLTYTHPSDDDIECIVSIGATGVTWDDIDFVGDTPPAVLTPAA